MEDITVLILVGFVLFFLIAMKTKRFEMTMLSFIMGFATFLIIGQDSTIPVDALPILYVVDVAMLLFTCAWFFGVGGDGKTS